MKPVAWAILFLGGTLCGAFGQCQSGVAVSANNISVETTGGITYLKFSYTTVCPQRLWKKSPVVQGTNVTQSIFLISSSEICTFEFPPTVRNHMATLVIGQLDPGNYLLQLETGSFFFPGGPPTTLARVPFTVPPPQLTLSLLPANPGELVFQVNGTSNVTYEVQSSSTLTNWTTVQTSAGGPCTVTRDAAGSKFYRVQASDGVPVCLY